MQDNNADFNNTAKPINHGHIVSSPYLDGVSYVNYYCDCDDPASHLLHRPAANAKPRSEQRNA